MRILNEPSKQKWEHESTCGACQTRVAVSIEDFKRTSHDQREGSAAIYECPTCHRENWVDFNVIPRQYHHRLPR